MSKPSNDFEADIGKKYSVGKVTVVIESVLAEGKILVSGHCRPRWCFWGVFQLK